MYRWEDEERAYYGEWTTSSEFATEGAAEFLEQWQEEHPKIAAASSPDGISAALKDVEGARYSGGEWTIRSGDDRKIEIEPKNVPGVGRIAYLSFSKGGSFGGRVGGRVGGELQPGTLDFAHTLVDTPGGWVSRASRSGTSPNPAVPGPTRACSRSWGGRKWPRRKKVESTPGSPGHRRRPRHRRIVRWTALLAYAYELGENLGSGRREKSISKQFGRGNWKVLKAMDQAKVIAVDLNRTLATGAGVDPEEWGEPTDGAVEATG